MAGGDPTSAEFDNAKPVEQLLMLKAVLDECAERCGANMLVSGTWVQESFEGASERVMEIHANLERGNP